MNHSVRVFRLAILLAVLALPMSASSEPGKTATYKLMVFETRDCFYCQHFRYAVAPVYQQSELGTRAPIEYVDVRQTDMNHLGLESPITIAPTTVLTQNGKEVARLSGVTSPDNFLILIGHMIERRSN